MLGIIAVILILWALRASWVVSMPLAFAIFLAVLVWPLQRRLERRLPSTLSAIVVMIPLALALAIGIGVVWLAAAQIAERGLPYAQQLQQRLEQILGWAREHGVQLRWDQLSAQGAPERFVAWLSAGLRSIWTALGLFGFIIVLLVLLLFEIDQWRRKAATQFNDRTSRAILDSGKTIVDQLQRFLLVRTAMSLMAGVGTWLLCVILGVDFAFVWGLIAFVFNYLPNIGSLLSYIPPTLFAWLQYDWKWALLVLACIGGLDAILGSVVDPKLQGKSLRLSPLVVMVSVVFWGWMWGIPGAILGVPITASLVIIAQHADRLRPFARLVGEVK